MAKRNAATAPNRRHTPSGDSFDHDLLSKQPPYERSPPRTPPAYVSRAAKGNGLAKAPRRRPALGDTFNTDNARGNSGANEHHRFETDSHDLSWSPRQTRDSVVDNMLLSFDQLSVGGNALSRRPDNNLHSSIRPQGEPYSSGAYKPGRSRGHTFSSSLSSDYDTHGLDSRHSNPKRLSHGYRSDSASNFQSALRRIGSVRNDDPTPRVKGKLYGIQGATGSEEKGVASRSGRRKGSKSSGSSSVDYGQMVRRPRWQRSTERRSSSLEHESEKRADTIPVSDTIARAPLTTARSRILEYNDYEAAPTPIIPAGPRRNHSPPPGNTFPSSTLFTTPHSVQHRRDNGFPSAHTHPRARTERLGNPAHQTAQESGARAMKSMGEIPTLLDSVDMLPRNLGTSSRKPSIVPVQTSASQSKDRPGFFRRVFGSSRNITPTSNETASRQEGSNPSHDNIRVDSHAGQASSRIPTGAPTKISTANEHLASPPKELPPMPLNKKSSFFRRRKKSMSEDIPIPILPVQLQPQFQAPPGPWAADSSPVSSLRMVMNPYLSSPVPSHLHHEEIGNSEPSKHELAYLAGYAARNESSKKPDLASITVHKPFASRERDLASPKRGIPKVKQSSERPVYPIHDDSFLHDSSGNEGKFDPAKSSDRELDMIEIEQNKNASSSVSSSANGIILLQKESEGPNDETKSVVRQPKVDLEVSSIQPLALSSLDNKLTETTGPSTPERLVLQELENPNASPKNENTPSKSLSGRSIRIWLQPTTSEENLSQAESEKRTGLTDATPDSARISEASVSDYRSVSSKVSSPTKDIITNVRSEVAVTKFDDSPEVDPNQPTDSDRQQAKRIFDGDDSEVDKSKAAPWLGEARPERARVRKAYMELFDWWNLNILAGLRGLCSRLLLKGETQQVDRILDAFSTRWCECNPNHGFKATDVVHTICYSILLLNTDLHMVGIEQKMTRTQFIKNTVPTIRRVAADAAPEGFETMRTSILPPARGSSSFFDPPSPRAATFPLDLGDARTSFDNRRPTNRLSTRPSDHSGEAIPSSNPSTPFSYDTPIDDCGLLVKAPFYGRLNVWEVQIEMVLKDFYNSIRQQRLPLFGSDEGDGVPEPTPSASSLSALTGGILRRTPSMLSKAGSESQTMRGRLSEARLGNGRWASKTRSRPRIYPASGAPSSRTSFDDQSSVTSPYASSTWSKYSMGKTQTSMSVNSFASSFPQADYQQSIGFANALSQAIIREETAGNDNNDENIRVAPVLEDESLELAGAPWAKEGILKHKHHLESVDKRAKDRNWMECFAVIEKGWLQMFQFNMSAKSIRQKAKNQKSTGGVVGGGNWTENAEAIGKFLLRQTLASALPPPGYSKSRPHVWALSLPTGAVHLFQAGTPEIVKEFVTTANYWSARLSKEPLMGGISNVEYGWSEMVINTALLPIENRPPSNNTGGPRPSLQSSIRSSMDQGNVKPKLPGDRVTINDWTPPQQSMMASALLEVDQLKALVAYEKNINEEFAKHNELRSVILLAFSPRHPNSGKAMANWERKSAYLLKEIVKFRTYIDCLREAQIQKEKLSTHKADEGTTGAKEEEEEEKAGCEESGVILTEPIAG